MRFNVENKKNPRNSKKAERFAKRAIAVLVTSEMSLRNSLQAELKRGLSPFKERKCNKRSTFMM